MILRTKNGKVQAQLVKGLWCDVYTSSDGINFIYVPSYSACTGEYVQAIAVGNIPMNIKGETIKTNKTPRLGYAM